MFFENANAGGFVLPVDIPQAVVQPWPQAMQGAEIPAAPMLVPGDNPPPPPR